MTSSISRFKRPHDLLNHMLDEADLPAIVKQLDAGVLTRIIRHVGLEDSAEIVALTTAEQLNGIFDEDLWKNHAPGKAEAFDAQRFGLWLEVMLEAGPAVAAKKILELDEDLVVLGLCRLVFVFGRSDMASRFHDSRHPILENLMDSGLNQEFDHYLVSAKIPSSWDAVCSLMAELNELEFEKLTHILERCRLICIDNMESDEDLFHVLSGDESLEEDVAADREERRDQKGFVTPTSASVFLSEARTSSLTMLIASKLNDPVTRAYFTTMESQIEPAANTPTAGKASENEDLTLLNVKVAQFIQTLQGAEILPASDHKLLMFKEAESWDHHLLLSKPMGYIHEIEPALYAQLIVELSYLSNTLIAGCEFKRRPFQPKEAAQAAFSVCNLGIEILLKTEVDMTQNQVLELTATLLKENHLVKLFKIGWKILFEKVLLFSANEILKFLNRLIRNIRDPEHKYEITHMADTFQAHIASGKPWEVNDRMDDLLTVIDGQTVAALEGLIQAYPTMADTICKNGGHPLSPYIWSKRHIRTIRQFITKSFEL